MPSHRSVGQARYHTQTSFLAFCRSPGLGSSDLHADADADFSGVGFGLDAGFGSGFGFFSELMVCQLAGKKWRRGIVVGLAVGWCVGFCVEGGWKLWCWDGVLDG